LPQVGPTVAIQFRLVPLKATVTEFPLREAYLWLPPEYAFEYEVRHDPE
jgi:hypothetical protein